MHYCELHAVICRIPPVYDGTIEALQKLCMEICCDHFPAPAHAHWVSAGSFFCCASIQGLLFRSLFIFTVLFHIPDKFCGEVLESILIGLEKLLI